MNGNYMSRVIETSCILVKTLHEESQDIYLSIQNCGTNLRCLDFSAMRSFTKLIQNHNTGE